MDLRQYDPAIARWNGIDPVTHFDYSPYQAFDNNPAYWADPSGADAESEECATCDVHGRQTIENGRYISVSERQQREKAQGDGLDFIAARQFKTSAKLFFGGEDVSQLREEDKQLIFKEDAVKTVGILLWEFATGTGKGSRKFQYGVHPFANSVFEGRIINEIVDEFNGKLKNDGYDFSKVGNSNKHRIWLEFSPNSNPNSWMESLNKHIDSNLPQFFIGGAFADVEIQDKNLIIQIYNETSRSSLMLHIGSNYDRVPNSEEQKPLSTIKQYIKASFKLETNN